MAECHNEILMNIPDEDLESLAEMYRRHSDIAYASSIITQGIKIRNKRNFIVRFMSTGNSWRDDGTFFAIMEFPHTYDLAVFTLDKSCRNVYEGLMRTKRIHYQRGIVFYAVHQTVYQTVLKVIEKKKLQVTSDGQYFVYSTPRVRAVCFQIECPEEVEIRKLNVTHAKLINSLWPENFTNSEEFIVSLIDLNGGFGLFLKSTNELVSWVVKNGLGQLGVIQTEEKHRRKGYGSLVVKLLSKEIAEDNEENPTGMVRDGDSTSQNMFKKLGFTNMGLCHYIHLQKPD